jgi:hypothetical protein
MRSNLYIRLTTEARSEDGEKFERKRTMLPVSDLDDARQLCERLNHHDDYNSTRRYAVIFVSIWNPYAGRVTVEVHGVDDVITQLLGVRERLWGQKTLKSLKTKVQSTNVEFEEIEAVKADPV